MSSAYAIEKLDDSNYSSWCVQMKSVLIHSELWAVVSGSLKSEGSTQEVAAFNTKDEKALASIMLSIKPSQILHVKNCKSSFEAWQKLSSMYKPRGPARKITLFRKLLSIKLHEGGSMSDHINEFCETLENLNEIKVEIPEEMVTIMLLTSLSDSYDNFIVAMETRDSLPSTSMLKNKLLEEGTRRQEKSCRSDQDHAYVVKANIRKNSTANNNNNRNQTANNNNRNLNSNKRFFGKCYICHKRGHCAADCNGNRRKWNKEEVKEERSFATLATLSNKNLKQDNWCIDSGATSHLCSDRKLFEKYKAQKQKISLAGEHFITAEGIGDIKITADKCNITLTDVLHVPNISCNFISVSKVIKAGFNVQFSKNSAVIKERDGFVIMRAKLKEGLFMTESNEALLALNCASESMLWHSRYGHLNFHSLKEMSKNNLVNGLQSKYFANTDCVVCAKSKITVKPFQSSVSETQDILEVIHSDICGPMNNCSNGGARYFITFIDDKSRYISVNFLKSKDEAFETFKKFKAFVELQTGNHIKVLRTDNGREYINQNFKTFLENNGIQHQLTVPHTPQQNGVAERANRTLIEMARCLLLQSNLSEKFWAEATATAVYLRNRAVTSSLNNKTPFEVWFKEKPNVSHFKVFGCKAVALDKTATYKYRPKGKELIMVGYSNESKAYRLYNPENRKIIVSRDVKFFENAFNVEETTENEMVVFDFNKIITNTTDGQEATADEADAEEDASGNDDDDVGANDGKGGEGANTSKSGRLSTSIVRFRGGRPRLIRTGVRGRPRKQKQRLHSTKPVHTPLPSTFQEAKGSEYSKEWLRSMDQEYNTLVKNDTWELSNLPHGKRAINSKWVYNIKKDENGNIKKFKSRLVAKGCSQRYGVDFKETFSPVVRYATIRLFLALACEYGLHLHQMDVAAAYINNDLHDEVYIKQPEGYVNASYPQKVLKLKKALYGLKQSGREWNFHLDSKLKQMGFKSCASEPCVYVNNCGGNYNIIMVYVDDLIIGCSQIADLNDIKAQISARFEVVDGGELHYFLGMEICCGVNEIKLCQRRYIDELLTQYNMKECRNASTPLDPGFQWLCNKETCPKVDLTNYQSLIGALMYLALATRPDILHSVCKLAQCVKDPHAEHEAGAKHILRYLNATQKLQIHYKKTGLPIYAYVDADWANDQMDRKSYTGCAFIAAGAAIYWESKKQSLVALSSTEAEYVAMSMAAKEAVFIRKILFEMGFPASDATTIYGDNRSAQQLVKNPVFHSRSKHIDIKYHYVREINKRNEISVKYICTENMAADILTKNLSKVKHNKFTEQLGLK